MNDDRESGRRETDLERLDRNLIELLNEIRVALPGVQVLFAFLLTVPFSSRFEALSRFEKGTFMVTFLLTTVATALLMAPTAFHRLRFRQGDKDALVRFSNRFTIAGIAILAIAIASAVFLVGELVVSIEVATVLAVVVLIGFAFLWFVLPLSRRSNTLG